jgi:hypothetical protein
MMLLYNLQNNNSNHVTNSTLRSRPKNPIFSNHIPSFAAFPFKNNLLAYTENTLIKKDGPCDTQGVKT